LEVRGRERKEQKDEENYRDRSFIVCIVDVYRKGRKTGICPPLFESSKKRQKLQKNGMYQKLMSKTKIIKK
jgi:hypothetical protein